MQPSEAVLHHGDVSHALYFIRTGQAAVYKPRNSRNSSPVILPIPGKNELRSTSDGDSGAGIKLIEEDMERVAVLDRGAAFGEQSFMSELPSTATVRVINYSEIMRLWKSEFEAVVVMYPALRMHMLGVQRELRMSYRAKEAREQFLRTDPAHNKSGLKSLIAAVTKITRSTRTIR